MSKVAVLIPTRLKSTRLPNKPLAIINGKTLIQHVYEHAIKVHAKEDVYIAAGDQEIIDEAKKFGAQAILTDPSLPSGTDRIAAALKEIDPDGTKYDIAISFQGDGINVDPALNLKLVDAAIEEYIVYLSKLSAEELASFGFSDATVSYINSYK